MPAPFLLRLITQYVDKTVKMCYNKHNIWYIGGRDLELKEIGVTERKAKQFETRGITDVESLLRYSPSGYMDFRIPMEYPSQDKVGEFVSFSGWIESYRHRGSNGETLQCTITHGIAKVQVFWFHQNWMENKIVAFQNAPVLVGGKLAYNADYKSYSISNPIIFEPDCSEARKIIPKYRKIKGMSNDYLLDSIQNALKVYRSKDYLTEAIRKEFRLCNKRDLFLYTHMPSCPEEINASKRRLIFDDMFYFASKLLQEEQENVQSSFLAVSQKAMERAIQSLPYQLTDDQKNAVEQIAETARSGSRINALLQGDVGCGKTIVAFLTMMLFAENGYQTVLMAPTQVLAAQHYEDMQQFLNGTPYSSVYLRNGMRAKEKRETLAKIASGEAQFIIGTHSLLADAVQYKNLALIITDEEHKFGVLQREALVQKADSGVHSITMSATPIPRSIAQTLYGDSKQVFTIKQMPNGRKPVITSLSESDDKTIQFIADQVKQGRQAYVVCPLIQEADNERMEGVESVDEVYESMCTALSPFGIQVGRLTGKDTAEQMAQILEQFQNNQIQVLVSTTVIEVGVNVPNASLVVIRNAERFGLAQLHQIRGRVGRGQYQSFCILCSDDCNNHRLQVMCQTNDGFKIAEADLCFRGTGDLIGTKQSGDNHYIDLIMTWPGFYGKVKKKVKELIKQKNVLNMVS